MGPRRKSRSDSGVDDHHEEVGDVAREPLHGHREEAVPGSHDPTVGFSGIPLRRRSLSPPAGGLEPKYSQRSPERSEATIDVATVADVHDHNHQTRLFDLVDDPIVTTPDPIEVTHAFELLHSGWAGHFGQASDL